MSTVAWGTRTDPEAARSLLADVALALLTGFGAALAKRYLDFHLGIPGHAGVGWIAVMIAGSLVNRRPGMALVAGASVGLWGVPLGLGHSLGYNTALYATAATAIEGARLLRVPASHVFGAMLVGAGVHVAKYGFVFGMAASSGIVKRIEVLGVLPVLFNHVIFGIAGGLLGWLAVRAGREAQRARRGR